MTGIWLASATQAFAAEGSGSCTADSEVRQLDYWLGHWTMKSAGGSSASSKVTLSLDKCMFIEHWENGKGHVTEKMFAYSPENKNWGGMFADNEGQVHVFFAGKVSSGIAEFHGPSRGPNGETVLHKLRVVRTAPDRLEETWEKSVDNGANWTTLYRAEYSRVSVTMVRSGDPRGNSHGCQRLSDTDIVSALHDAVRHGGPTTSNPRRAESLRTRVDL